MTSDQNPSKHFTQNLLGWLTNKSNLSLLVVMTVAIILRFINLGYSNYQGDEIKALFLPTHNQSFWSFLLDQRKGPLQFIVTYLLHFINPTYSNEFLVRLPFALASLLTVYFFYQFIKSNFGQRIALFSAFFMATNGFFVAFGRIVQYQSLVILFSVLALYFLDKAVKNAKYQFIGIYLGLASWALAVLAHYDGLFIAPVAFWLLARWFVAPNFNITTSADVSKPSFDLNTSANLAASTSTGRHSALNKKHLLHFIFAGLIAVAILSAFYIPFTLELTKNTVDYWQGRLTGTASTKLSSSIYLFKVYQPVYVLYIYLFFAAIGAFAVFVTHQAKRYAVILAWILLPIVFWEKLVYISGTHIYTYLMPLFIIIGIGIVSIENLLCKLDLPKTIIFKNIFLAVLCAFIFAQSYTIFVDNFKEYPWQDKQFLYWTLHMPDYSTYNLSLFGFPYYRNWEGVQNFVKQHPGVKGYSTNERESMADYYVGLPKGVDNVGFYIFIRNPQRFTNTVSPGKPSYWANKYSPVYTYSRNGVDLVNVYLMPVGTLQEITVQGF